MARATPKGDPVVIAVLKAECRAQNLTPHALASKAGVAGQTLHDILNGADPRLSTLRKLLGGLGVSMIWLQYQIDSYPSPLPAAQSGGDSEPVAAAAVPPSKGEPKPL